MRKRVLIGVVALVVVVGVAFAGTVAWHRLHRSNLDRAMHDVPASTKRVSFTDWAAVRRELHVPDRAAPAPGDVAAWLHRAYRTDLSAASSIDDSGRALQRYYGFSPGNADWEAYAQSKKGAAMVLRLDDDVDFDTVAHHLAAIGYHKPSSDTGVWRGGVDLVAALDESLTPEVQYVALLADQHLVITSDTASYAAAAVKVARGDADSAADVTGLTDMVGHLDEPAAAVVWPGDFACSDLAMSQADAASQQLGAQLIARAGKVSPLSGLVMALSPGGTLTVAEQFESGQQARDNLRARARLAVGDAVGRGESTFSDDYRLTESRTEGSTVLLRMVPRPSNAYPLSSLYDGPVLFATC